MSTEAAILAGGQARRFGGRDKSALLVGGRRILERQVAMLRPLTQRIAIVGGPPERFIGMDLPVVQDLVAGAGALGGVYTALVQARADRVLVLACDMPFVTTAFLARLFATGRDADVTIPRDALGLHPLCAAWDPAAAPVVRELLDHGTRRVREALSRLRLHVIEGAALDAFDPDGRLLRNINTPEEYAAALAED